MAVKAPADNLLAEIEFVSHEERQMATLSLKDIIEFNDENTDSQTNKDPISPEMLDDLMNIAPPDASIEQRQGFTQVKTIEHKPFALHYAAKNSPLSEIKKLVEEHGFDVNAEDMLSSRPLYIAALHGHTQAVKYFLEKGADVHDFSYDYETALHVAVEKKHYDIARMLVEKGDAEIALVNIKNETPTDMLIKQYMSIIDKSSKKTHKAESIETMMEITKTLEVFSKHCGEHFLSTITLDANNSFEIPVGYFLDKFASRAPTIELRDKLLTLKQSIEAFDSSSITFEHAKNLLNTFPNNKTYQLNFDANTKTAFFGAGHLGCSTTKWASDSLNAYYEHLKKYSINQEKLTVFSKLSQIFEAATALKSNGEIEAYAIAAQERYDNGETVLLGSGWDTHFIDVVLSKNQELFITGNSGLRCFQYAPGLNLYHMNKPDAIKADFMHDMTVNLDKTHLERDVMYQYELIEQVGTKQTSEQKYSNCTWVGHQHGIEACLYVELLNLGVKTEMAGPLASKYYGEWEHFHALFQIDSYMKNHPGLPAQALIDMFITTIGKSTNENQALIKTQAHKLCEALVSEHYQSEFKTWLNNPTNKALTKLFEPYMHLDKLIEPEKNFTSLVTDVFKKLIFGDHSASKVNKSPLQEDAGHHPEQMLSTDKITESSHLSMATHDPLPHFEPPVTLVM